MKKIVSILAILVVSILVLSGVGLAAVTKIKPILDNHPPDVPKITGPTNIKIHEPYNYSFIAIDWDGDNISYQIDWKDGEISNWTEWYPSNREIVITHTYHEKSFYQIMARAKDIHGSIGEWGKIQLGVSKGAYQSFSVLDINEDALFIEDGENTDSAETDKEIEILSNRPPHVPSDPTPEDGEDDVPIDEIFISWESEDPDGDPVVYDVYFGEINPPPLVADNQVANRYNPGIMDTYTTFYWQIVTMDFFGLTTPGPIWNFTTGSRINRPPNPPEIIVEKIGENTFLIKFKLTDPDGDNLKALAVIWDKDDWGFIYHGDWPNGTTTEGEMKVYSKGRHQIKVSCLDRWRKWGDEAVYEIIIPKNKAYNFNSLFFQILQRLLNLR